MSKKKTNPKRRGSRGNGFSLASAEEAVREVQSAVINGKAEEAADGRRRKKRRGRRNV